MGIFFLCTIVSVYITLGVAPGVDVQLLKGCKTAREW